MTELSPLPSLENFGPHVGEEFLLCDRAGHQAAVKLSSATSHGFNRPAAEGGRESFSLIFHASAGVRVPQGTFTFKHPVLGSHEFFLVPLGPDADGLQFQVIFNFN